MPRKLIPGVDKIKEDWVKDRVREILKEWKKQHPNTLHWWMPPAAMYGVVGQHDFCICQLGQFWSIETKAGKKPPTENQITFAENIKAACGLSLLINELNYMDVETVLQDIDLNGYIRDFTKYASHDFTKYRK